MECKKSTAVQIHIENAQLFGDDAAVWLLLL